MLLTQSQCLHAFDVDYEREVAPVLKTYCAGCHNDTDKEGDLSLITLGALRIGSSDGPVVVASKPEESKLYQVIAGAAEPKMPPKDEPQLKPEHIQLLARLDRARGPRVKLSQASDGEVDCAEIGERSARGA